MADDIKRKDAQMRATINQKLVETGERDSIHKIKQHNQLQYQKFTMQFCLEVVKQKGLEHITVDDLVAEITPKGRVRKFDLLTET
uniref:Enhancer of yellow 2 transcription factor-like protein n=1 Tax=Magallana gigas TaxID=29159 RepID=K1PVY7_MAGGI